jgi:tRNA (mo5U34)-methyltransferase
VELKEEVSKYVWFHTIDLGNGVVTPGQKTADIMALESDILFGGVKLDGKSFLDVGAGNGGFTVEAARRGANRIAALDHNAWRDPKLRGRESFELVSRVFGNRFEMYDIDLDRPKLSLEELGQFDVVLYSGVFYRLFDPIAVTSEVSALAKELLIVESHVVNRGDNTPLMEFYPGRELNGDRANWWGPNVACMVALLNHFGFRSVSVRDGSARNRKIFHAYRA